MTDYNDNKDEGGVRYFIQYDPHKYPLYWEEQESET